MDSFPERIGRRGEENAGGDESGGNRIRPTVSGGTAALDSGGQICVYHHRMCPGGTEGL